MKQVRGAARLALALALGAGCALAAAEDAAARYARLMADAESIAAHNELIQRQIGSQESELAELQAQLASLDTTSAEFGPLLERMFTSLEQFVAADVPFIDPISDRKARMDRLRELMTTEGTSPAERFRRLMEAYQIEMEYGRTMSDYKGALPDGREGNSSGLAGSRCCTARSTGPRRATGMPARSNGSSTTISKAR